MTGSPFPPEAGRAKLVMSGHSDVRSKGTVHAAGYGENDLPSTFLKFHGISVFPQIFTHRLSAGSRPDARPLEGRLDVPWSLHRVVNTVKGHFSTRISTGG
jgi:hypothetical protein